MSFKVSYEKLFHFTFFQAVCVWATESWLSSLQVLLESGPDLTEPWGQWNEKPFDIASLVLANNNSQC